MKQALAERDARLSSYRFEAKTQQGAEQATHAFFFRSPNRLRAHLQTPVELQWSFDGQRLFKLAGAQQTHTTLELKLPKDQAAVFLNATFSPFVREGFRTPLMPSKGVSATRVTHPRASDAVELKVEPGEGVTVTYVLRLPSADFLERRMRSPSAQGRLEVLEEHCDPALKLCVPRKLVEAVDGAALLTVELTALALNEALAAEDFTLPVPEGWVADVRQVVAQ